MRPTRTEPSAAGGIAKGALAITASAFGFAVMAALVRLSDDFGSPLSTFQKGFFRNVVAFMIALADTAMTVYAHWADYQTVIFDPQGGTHEPSSVSCAVTYSGFTMPTWDDNHKFLGWFDEDGKRVKAGMEVTGGAANTL